MDSFKLQSSPLALRKFDVAKLKRGIMRIKPGFGSALTATVGGSIAYFLYRQHQATSLTSSHETKRSQETTIQRTPLPIASLKETSDSSLPRINISSDRRDLSHKNLTLVELKELDEEVQNNPFVGHIIWGTLPSGEEAHKLRTKIEQQVIKNNQAYQRYPSDFVHGLLSLHVYQNAQPKTTVTFLNADYQHYNQYLSQWRINSVHDLPECGRYYAVSYNNDEARQLVLAHRGTTVTWQDLFKKDSPAKTDLIGVFAGEIVAQQRAAYRVTKEVATYAKDNHYHFSTTGHSLGAWLAELSVYYSVFEFKIPAKAVTFDSPGSITMESFHPNIVNHNNARDVRDLDIVTYLSDPNFVNTCHRHVGQVYRLYPEYPKPYLSQFTGLEHAGFWSLWGHALVPLLATFDPLTGKPVKVERMARWPVVTYTPRDKVGKNMVTAMLGTADQDSNQLRLITSLLHLIGDVGAGRIDQSQYLKYWEILSAFPSKEEAILKGGTGDQFALKYEASYESLVNDPLTGQFVSPEKGSLNWYLKKLHDCPIEKILHYFGEENLITQQLVALKAQYHIAIEIGHGAYYQLNEKNLVTIEDIKERILRLLDVHVTDGKVKAFLETHEQQPLPSLPPLKLTSYLPPSLGSQYILRVEDLDRIDHLLATQAYVIISGEPGFGKTSLATEYGHRQKNRPSHAKIVIRMDADSQEKIHGEYRNIATQLGIHTEQQTPELIMRLVYNEISNSQKPVLLIFDNVESHAHIAPYIDYLPAGIKALITTRDSRLVEGVPTIKIKPFTHREAQQYIESSPIKDRTNREEVQALIHYYAKGSDYVLPYHLNRAVSIIKQQPIGGIKNYLAFVNAHPDEEGELMLQQKLMAKSKLAWPMLQYAAYLDPDTIDLRIFEQVFNVDQDALNEAIRILESLSAMTVISKDGQQALSLHRLTQKIVKDFINNPAHQDSCLATAKILAELIKNLNQLCPYVSNNPDQKWQQARELMPHIEAVLNYLPENIVNPVIAMLLAKSGKYAREALRQYQKAHSHCQKSLAIRQILYPDQLHPDLAASLDDVGDSYEKLGGEDNQRRGLLLKEQALTMLQALYPDQPHPDVAQSLNNVGVSYAQLGGRENREKGLKLQEQALTMLQALYPDQPHPDVALSLNNIGFSYGELGGEDNQRKGLMFLEQALAMRQALYPDQPHPDVAVSLNNIGYRYWQLGGRENREKGLRLQEQALAIVQALYPDQPHPDMARSLNNIGLSYKDLGGEDNQRKGLMFLEQALAMQQVLYPDQLHPDVATSLNSLGVSQEALGGRENREKGLKLQEQALVMYRALYPDQPHPDVALSLSNVGGAYERLGGEANQRKGLALQEQALAMRQALYPDQPHPEVAASLNDVGYSYIQLGGRENKEKGLRLQEQALAMWQALYPDQPHPEVAISLSNVGYVYATLEGVDNIQKGLKLQEQALAMYQALYPDQPHPNVATSLSHISRAYLQLGGIENARQILHLQEQALAMRQALYLDQLHPELAASLAIVGYLYANSGGGDIRLKGLKLQEQALAMLQALYPDQPHSDVVFSLTCLGESLIRLGRKEDGQDYLRQAKAMQQELEKHVL
jgi:hypothetical protein